MFGLGNFGTLVFFFAAILFAVIAVLSPIWIYLTYTHTRACHDEMCKANKWLEKVAAEITSKTINMGRVE
jgi:hypothetical protein